MKQECLPLREGSYSTSERLTGRKWIDGKDIYERVFTGNFPQTNSEYKINLLSAPTGIDKVIHVYGYTYGTSPSVSVGNQFPIPFQRSNNMFLEVWKTNNDTLDLSGISSWCAEDYWIVVEYTKT